MKRLLTIFAAMSTMSLMAQTPINIIVGSKTFTATLADSETGEAFAALLPLTVTMNELNGNEKYHYLSSSLPTAAYQPGTIHAGDLPALPMLLVPAMSPSILNSALLLKTSPQMYKVTKFQVQRFSATDNSI